MKKHSDPTSTSDVAPSSEPPAEECCLYPQCLHVGPAPVLLERACLTFQAAGFLTDHVNVPDNLVLLMHMICVDRVGFWQQASMKAHPLPNSLKLHSVYWDTSTTKKTALPMDVTAGGRRVQRKPEAGDAGWMRAAGKVGFNSGEHFFAFRMDGPNRLFGVFDAFDDASPTANAREMKNSCVVLYSHGGVFRQVTDLEGNIVEPKLTDVQVRELFKAKILGMWLNFENGTVQYYVDGKQCKIVEYDFQRDKRLYYPCFFSGACDTVAFSL